MRRPLRIAVVGHGYQGREHLALLRAGIPGAITTAVVDRGLVGTRTLDGLPAFTSLGDCLSAQVADAVIIATPHASHVALAIHALQAGLHVLCEKPVAVDRDQVDGLLAAQGDRVLAAVHQQRCDPCYRRLRQLITAGELGPIQRVSWTVTDWYRTERYYRQAPWRGTWAGEGGGLLVNQAVHQLDLWCWLFGLPRRVQARCRFGAWHGIEAEDDVSAICELPGGGSGIFTASTGDSPGVNRLEVDCDRGRVVVEGGVLRFRRTAEPLHRHRADSVYVWDHPVVEDLVEQPAAGWPLLRILVTDFAAACREGRQPIAPVAEARDQVALSNAILVSAVEERTVTLPLPTRSFARILAGLAEGALAAVG